MILEYGGESVDFPMGLSPFLMITTFPQASLRSRRVGFPESGSDLGATPRSPSRKERGLSADPHPPHFRPVYFQGRCIASFTGSVSGDARNHQVPRAPSRTQGVTSRAVAAFSTSAGVTPPSSLLLAHASILCPPTAYGHCLGQRVCAGCGQPLLDIGPSQRFLHESFPRCLDPYPGGPHGARTRFFPQGIGLPHFLTGSALHKIPDNDFSPGIDFEAAAIHSCSGLWVCSPPRSFPPQRSLPVRHRVAAVGFGG